MSGHTPGSWEVDGFRIVAECNGFSVADVNGPDRRARGKEWKEDMDCCIANANLIAAAPDLLAALEVMLAQFSKTPSTLKDTQARACAHRAVAKAKGETP
jgi:hypothetical protein